MQQLTIRVHPDDADVLSGLLFQLGAQGVEERDEPRAALLIVYAESDDELLELQQALLEQLDRLRLKAKPTFTLAPLALDYQRAWLEHLGPQWLTDQLVIQPVGFPDPGSNSKAIYYEPEMAFGTGSHPTTRLAARAVSEACQRLPDLRLLDVGCGNGVLALVSVICGARHARGIDTDPRSVSAATRNARLNGLSERTRFDSIPLADLEEDYDVVVANIDAATLGALAPDLCARTRHTLLLTGLLDEQRAELQPQFEGRGLRLRQSQSLEDWCLLSYERSL